MTPFAKPLPAKYEPPPDGPSFDPVPPARSCAVIATDDAEYLAVDEQGATFVGLHAHFRIAGGEVNQAIWEATMADGS